MKTLGIILAVLVLLALLPIGVVLRYDGTTLVQLRFGPLRLTLLPKKQLSLRGLERQQRKKEKKKAEAERRRQRAVAKKLRTVPTDEPKKSLLEKIQELEPFFKLGVRFLGSFRRRLFARELTVRVIIAGNDAAKTARSTGLAWAAIGNIRPMLTRAFRIKSNELSVTPDFVGEKSTVYACLRIRILLGEIVALAVKYACKAVSILLKGKQNRKAVSQ